MRARLLWVAVGTLAALLASACSNDSSDGRDSRRPTVSQADVEFVTAMVPHHEQALRMAAMASARSVSPRFAELLANIRRSQSAEIRRMSGWLEAWGDPRVPGFSGHGGWFGFPGDDDGGPGMMGPSMGMGHGMMRPATGHGFRDMWLAMMIQHHEAAVEMARTELKDGSFSPALELAESIRRTQTAEIRLMQRMLAR